MSTFHTVWIKWTDDVGADRGAAHRIPRSRYAKNGTVAGPRQTDPTMRMVRLQRFEIELVLRALDRMRDQASRAGDIDAAHYFHSRSTDIKNAARIRKVRRVA